MTELYTPLQEPARLWFEKLRDDICAAFEKLEATYAEANNLTPAKFERTAWERGENGGGGVMSVMRGNVFEKVGVNVSTVHGAFDPAFASKIPGADKNPGFWASGISLVGHMCSPLVPAVHMNTRHIVTQNSWFGGGADLTPYFPFEEDTKDFHTAFQAACDTHDESYYTRFKKWCDEYFYLPHRQEPRGIGGIFYDNLETSDPVQDFAFTQDVGRAFLDIYPKIVARRMHLPWTDAQREHQIKRRGRYVEFNLLYDRGTQFGLQTGGNTEAILMSMPPVVEWP